MDIFDFSEKVSDVNVKALKVVEQSLSKLDPDDVSSNNVKSIYMLTSGVKSLASAASDLERSTRERKHLHDEIADTMKAEIRLLLNGHQGLIDQVQAVISQAHDNLVSRLDGGKNNASNSPVITAEAPKVGQKYRQRQTRQKNTLKLPV